MSFNRNTSSGLVASTCVNICQQLQRFQTKLPRDQVAKGQHIVSFDPLLTSWLKLGQRRMHDTILTNHSRYYRLDRLVVPSHVPPFGVLIALTKEFCWNPSPSDLATRTWRSKKQEAMFSKTTWFRLFGRVWFAWSNAWRLGCDPRPASVCWFVQTHAHLHYGSSCSSLQSSWHQAFLGGCFASRNCGHPKQAEMSNPFASMARPFK